MNRISLVMIAWVSIAFLSLISLTACSNTNTRENDDGQQIFIGEDIAVAETSYGKVKGFIIRGIYAYRGIPYGASTSGENRFMPPQKPEPWEGILPTVFYGNSAPQNVYDRSSESYSAFVDHWNFDELSEDCLRLNVWSPEINDDKKRPVLVWLHGGGFSRGNGIEQDGYDGENIARFGDIVYCSINHRLGSLGFSHFAKVGGEKYKRSGNVGMLDIIAALEWIQENISNFGGDPGNVTIMGQSGGGSKVCILASMPAAKGLIHKGVVLSGEALSGNNKEYSEELGAYIIEEAGIAASEIDKLQHIPWEEYLALADRAAANMKRDKLGQGQRGGFTPVADGVDIPQGQFFSSKDSTIPDIPLLFCSTFHEWNPNRDNPEYENITLDEVVQKLSYYGDKTQSIVDAYAQAFPEYRPIEIWSLIVSNRHSIVRTANAKLGQTSPVYMGWFGWESPLFDGRHRAFHCIDISFWLLNTDLMITHTGGGKEPRQLSVKMADALINFMYNGDPNCKSLPIWPQYSAEKGETMIFNNKCVVKDDPDRDARKFL